MPYIVRRTRLPPFAANDITLALQHLPALRNGLAKKMELAVDEARIKWIASPGAHIDDV